MRWRPWRRSPRTTASTCSGCWCRPVPADCRPGRWRRALELAPNTLSFHFDRLRSAGLVTVRRAGRSMIYAARFETMNALLGYLTENCCQGAQSCGPAVCRPASAPKRKRKVPA